MKLRQRLLSIVLIPLATIFAMAQTPPPTETKPQATTPQEAKPSENKAPKAAENKSVESKPAETPSYQSLVERLKKNDRTVDFRKLRVAYAETPAFSPYGADREGRQKMFAALNDKKFDKAAEQAEKILSDKYVDIYAHFVAAKAYGEMGKAEKSDFHDFVFEL